MSEQEFKEGDLMPWQDMTAKIKFFDRLLEGTPEDVMVWEAILDIRRTLNWDSKKINGLERVIKNLQVFNDEHTERLQDMEIKISMLDSILSSNMTSEMMYARKINELEGILKSYFSESPSSRIAELEARVDSLTRSLDILQEVMGVEVVVFPENIGELYDEQNIAL